MDREEYTRVRGKLEQHRDATKARADEQFASDLKALDRIYALANDEDAAVLQHTVAAIQSNLRLNTPPPDLVVARKPTQMIRTVISGMGDRRFSMPVIHDEIERRFEVDLPKTAISSALNKLREGGEIVQLQPGVGRSPAVYRKNGVTSENGELQTSA
jgi:hypothetical protein